MADDVIHDVPSRFASATGLRAGDRFNLEKANWGAIWSGALVTVGMEILFLTFGLFINALWGGSTAWGMAWYLVTMGVSFYIGGVAAARMSDVADRSSTVYHALTTWGLATFGTAMVGLLIAGAALTRYAGPVFTPANWGAIIEWAGVIWGGVMLSFITAWFAGASSRPMIPAGGGDSDRRLSER
jgi:hypothetical protein